MVSHILIVDDDPNLRELSRAFLEGAGYDVTEAETGKIAVEALRSGSFDAVMTDLRMPAASGEALIQWILVNKPALKSRILIATGDLMSPGLKAFAKINGIPVLPKPYMRADILSAIARIVNVPS